MGFLASINDFLYNALTGKLTQSQIDAIGNNAIADVAQAGGDAAQQAAAASQAEQVASNPPSVSNPLGSALNPFEGGLNFASILLWGAVAVGAYFIFFRRGKK